MMRLSVNLNKVALLRNQRDCGYPDLLAAARTVLEAGAHGITLHPRPDERHVRKGDIPAMASLLESWPDKNIELNIEGYPSEDFLRLVCAHDCNQVTLVPDDPSQKTSDHGWNMKENKDFLKDTVIQLKDAGRRVSLFIDPDPAVAEQAGSVGADRVELYTGPYAHDHRLLPKYIETANAAQRAGLGVNAGHDLTLNNLGPFIAAIPYCEEVSIGHAITADALNMGWPSAVKAYLKVISSAQKSLSAA